MTRSSINRPIVIGLTTAFLLVIAFLIWQHTKPLIQTHHQTFLFEPLYVVWSGTDAIQASLIRGTPQ